MLRAPGGELPHGLCGPGVALDEVGGMEGQSRTKGGDEPEETQAHQGGPGFSLSSDLFRSSRIEMMKSARDVLEA